MARLTIRDVEGAVCAKFNLTVEEIRSDTRVKRIARPRQIAMYLIREKTNVSFPSIGKHFGVDHSTAVHGVQRITAMVAKKGKVAAYVSECRDAIPAIEAREAAKLARLRFWAERLRDGVASWPAHLPPPVSMIPPEMNDQAAEMAS